MQVAETFKSTAQPNPTKLAAVSLGRTTNKCLLTALSDPFLSLFLLSCLQSSLKPHHLVNFLL
jgi:hypothetical protein